MYRYRRPRAGPLSGFPHPAARRRTPHPRPAGRAAPSRTVPGGIGKRCLGCRGLGLELSQRNAAERSVGGCKPCFEIADTRRKGIAPGSGGPNLRSGVCKTCLGARGTVTNIGKGGDRLVAPRFRLVKLRLQSRRLALQAFDGAFGVPKKACLAGDVVAHLLLLAGYAFDGVTDPRLFTINLVARQGNPLIFGGAGHLRFAQIGQHGGAFGAQRRAGGGGPGSLFSDGLRGADVLFGFLAGRDGGIPARQQKLCLGLADPVGD